MRYNINDRKDFWNIPCNPITGYRIHMLGGGIPNQNIKKLFIKPLKQLNENKSQDVSKLQEEIQTV